MWRGPNVVRTLFFAGAIAGLCMLAPRASADSAVPVGLQARLISKVAAFDRNMQARAAGTVHILIIQKPGDAESGRVANQMANALGSLGDIAGMPKDVEVAPYSGAGGVADLCRGKHISIVYLTPGLDGDIAQIAAAIHDVNVMSIGSSGSQVAAGASVGFELDEGKPQIVVNTKAKSQGVDLKAEVLKLAKIVG